MSCTTCNMHYIGKTYTTFKVRWSNHKSKLNKVINDGLGLVGLELRLESSEGDYHLLDHFAHNHTDLSSLKWVVLHNIGKVAPDPAGNLLR